MLFKPEHIHMILSGRKTETRRNWKKPRVKVNGIYNAKTVMLSKDCFARIKVLKLYKERLGDISQQSIYNEGYDSLEDYKRIWIDINSNWDDELVPYVINFELVKEARK